MSRLSTWALGWGIASAAALLASTSVADPLADLRARAKAASEPVEAIDVARALRRAGLAPEAVTTLQKALGNARGNDAVADLHLELERAYVDQHQGKKATRECDRIHKLSAFKEQLCIAEAQLSSRRGSVALPAAEQALTLVPGDYDALVAKARALAQLGKPDDAEATFRDASHRVPNRAEALHFLADLKLAQGKPDAALAALNEARRVAPDDPDVLLAFGTAAAPGPDARAALEHAAAIRPGFSVAQAQLGKVLAALGELDKAEQSLTAALQLEPRQADWHAALGEVYVAKGNADAAAHEAHLALEIVPNNGAAKLVEAKSLVMKGDIDLAIEEFEAAYGFARMDPTVLLEAARACIRGKRLTTAQAFADRATEDFPKSSAAWEVEGDVAIAMRDVPLAQQAYGKALAGEGPADKDAIRRKLAAAR
jgi:tetratricopeptide (TPR) repeat protein